MSASLLEHCGTVLRIAARALAFVAVIGSMRAEAQEIDHFADLGDTLLYPVSAAKGLALLFVDNTTVQEAGPALAASLNAARYSVAMVNIDIFFATVQHNRSQCLDPVTLLDVYSQHLQDRFRFHHYDRPTLVGTGSGGSFVYLLMHEAPRNWYEGAISVEFCPRLQLPAAPCGPVMAWKAIGGDALQLQPKPSRTAWVVIDKPAQDCAFNSKPVTEVATRILPDSPTALRSAVALVETEAASRDESTDDLPLVELPLAHPAGDFFAIVVSGDGGWANIDKDIGEELNRRGVPVVGWNSLQYFWSRKTPERAAADLNRVIAHFRAHWHLPRVMVIGYSLGADVLPFMLSRLEPAERDAIASANLLGLGHAVDFEFHLGNWLGRHVDQERPIAPELRKLKGFPIRCVFGDEDDDTICPELRGPQFIVVRKPGDHHFNGAYRDITDAILGVQR